VFPEAFNKSGVTSNGMLNVCTACMPLGVDPSWTDQEHKNCNFLGSGTVIATVVSYCEGLAVNMKWSGCWSYLTNTLSALELGFPLTWKEVTVPGGVEEGVACGCLDG